MIVRALMLADAVDAGLGGKVFIHGGGIRRVTGPQMPWTIPSLAVFAHLEAEDEAPGTDHEATIRFIGPDDDALGVELSANVRLAASDIEGLPASVNFAAAFGGITVKQAGIHRVELLFDGHAAADVSFLVEARVKAGRKLTP